MEDETLRQLTASEQLTLVEEYEMQSVLSEIRYVRLTCGIDLWPFTREMAAGRRQ
jgi:hypothetical protein